MSFYIIILNFKNNKIKFYRTKFKFKEMNELKIEGVFKEDFYKWLTEIKNYGNLITAFEYYYPVQGKIDTIMKFLHNVSFENPYLVDQHLISSIHTINKMIQNYNLTNKKSL